MAVNAAEIMGFNTVRETAEQYSPLQVELIESPTSDIAKTVEITDFDRLLSVEELPSIIPNIFINNPPTFFSTLETISGRTLEDVSQIQSIKMTELQMGKKAHILLCETTVAEEPFYFVTYLSRGAKQDERSEVRRLAEEAEEDFNNLKSVAGLFEDNLTSEALDQFSVVNPIVLGYVNYQGLDYPFYTTPFVPKGEISLDVVAEGNIAAFFRYAIAYNDRMNNDSHWQELRAREIAQDTDIGESTDDTIRKQKRELITLLSLIYLLTNRLPAEFKINAGDVMGILDDETLGPITLTTVRGGFTKELTEEEFAHTIITHTEPLLNTALVIMYGTQDVTIFADESQEDILEQLHNARSLLKPTV